MRGLACVLATGKVEERGGGCAPLELGQQWGGGPSLLTGKQERELSLRAETEGESLHQLRGVRGRMSLGPPWVQRSKPDTEVVGLCCCTLERKGGKGKRSLAPPERATLLVSHCWG